MFDGIFTALITPLDDEGRFDETSFHRLLQSQLDAGIHAIVPMGTTGEAATFADDEHIAVVRSAVEYINARVPVIAGCGSNDTAHFLHLAQRVTDAGADALLAVTPYYNKPDDEGLYRHFSALAKVSRLPIVLYNVPSRTGINMSVSVIARLAAEHKNIVGIKDAVPTDLMRTTEIHRKTGSEFRVLSGEDSTAAAGISVGMAGCISVTSNIAPQLMVALYQACRNGQRDEVIRLSRLLHPLNKALFTHPNPVPVKRAAKRLGLIAADRLRLPLTAMGEGEDKTLIAILKELKLLGT